MNKIKILVLSDSHGDKEQLDKVVKIINSSKDLDLVIHLGDFSIDAKYVEDNIDIKMINILGNCDFGPEDINDEEILNLNNNRILLTHGHRYNIKYGLNNLYYRAEELKVDAVLFGHIHRPVKLIEGGIVLFNPGSLSEARNGSKESYGLLNISDKIESKIVEI